jgi:hypothetical protein
MSAHTNAADAIGDTRVSGQMRRAGLSLRVRLRRRRIDRELADTGGSAISEAHALRAVQLASDVNRREAARSLREVVAAADSPRAEWFGSTALLDRDVAVAGRDGLMGLAQRLEQREPLGPCGIARARVLASDGMGPLYNPASERSLVEAISWIAEGLDMRPSSGA